MAKMFNKMLDLVGLAVDEVPEEVNNSDSDTYDSQEESIVSKYLPQKNKVVNMPTLGQIKVVVMQPTVFDDASMICDHLKGKKPVIVNLEITEKEVARRIVDFLSGSVYALDGTVQKVSSTIFIVAPNNVDILGEFDDDFRAPGTKMQGGAASVFPWTK